MNDAEKKLSAGWQREAVVPRRQRKPWQSTPYATAQSGGKARDEVIKILRRFGCESVGFMDDFDKHEVILAFKHRGRPIQLRASAQGWANMYLKDHPYTARRRLRRADYEKEVLAQGLVAVNSILRDWIKGQMVAVECGILQFEHVFMPYMLTASGQSLAERIKDTQLLDKPL